MQKLEQNLGEDVRSFMNYPTLFWFFAPTSTMLNICAATGAALAGIVCVLGAANMMIMLALWLLYISIVNVGQTWYSFGWESQLLGYY
jgi:lipase maturation factor 1